MYMHIVQGTIAINEFVIENVIIYMFFLAHTDLENNTKIMNTYLPGGSIRKLDDSKSIKKY